MHVLIVNFQLKGLSDDEWRKAAVVDAPSYNGLPGLISKIWLADPAANTYGGILLWRDRQAMESFIASEPFQGVLKSPVFDGVTWRDFAVLEESTAITGGPIAASLARA